MSDHHTPEGQEHHHDQHSPAEDVPVRSRRRSFRENILVFNSILNSIPTYMKYLGSPFIVVIVLFVFLAAMVIPLTVLAFVFGPWIVGLIIALAVLIVLVARPRREQ